MIKSISLFLFCLSLSILSAQTPAEKLDQELAAAFQSSTIPGCGVAIVNADKVLYTKYLGYADKENEIPYTAATIQNIASISKTFIGVALMKAVEQGKLKLEDNINQYLPFEVKHAYFPDQAITIQHLATHTSGIRDRIANYASKSYVLESPIQSTKGYPFVMKIFLRKASKNEKLEMGQYFRKVLTPTGEWYKKKNFYKWAPGSEYEYSNIAAALAAYIIEQATGQPYPEFTREHILAPLNMKHSGWTYAAVDESKFAKRYFVNGTPVPNYSLITYPDGGFITSVPDLSRYLMEMMRGYFSESKVLKKTSCDQMMRNQIQVPDQERQGIFWDVFGTDGVGDIGHSGSDPGVCTFMYFNPELEVGSIMFVNLDIGKKTREEIVAIWELLIKHQAGFTEKG